MTPELLCTDLDRTLVPNGDAPESPGAREVLSRVLEEHGIRLAYVSGRHLDLVLDAIEDYALPVPDFAICDVGSAIFLPTADGWEPLGSWTALLAREWTAEVRSAVDAHLAALPGLRTQGPERQSAFKASWFAPPLDDPRALLEDVDEALGEIPARVIYSVDETAAQGLLDLLPPRAGKRAAIEHLLEHCGIDARRTLFAGDSGNDLEVLTSPIPAVLVANATGAVRAQAREEARLAGTTAQLHFATGGILGMNGNYASGILEAIPHFWPATKGWIR